ncbi:MAG: hypothetical protein ACP5DC_01260 [Halothiobacillaceae bacterium]
MQLVKNLESETPWVEVRDPQTGRVAARFAGEELRALVTDGRLPLTVLLCDRPEGAHQAIRRLLLLACQKHCRLQSGLACLAGDCDLHPASNSVLPIGSTKSSALPLQRQG